MVPLEKVRDFVLSRCGTLPPELVPVARALGCVTAEAVIAGEDVPPFANTAMDGYAVRAADTAGAPVVLDVVATVAAGSVAECAVGPGQAVRIMTGAPMPAGADAVVMVERTSPAGQGAVLIEVAAAPGDHVRRAGDDIAAGQVVFQPATEITPAHAGVLASLGLESISVVPRPRVGVLSTGDELVDGPAPLAPGHIRDSNRPTLMAMLAESRFAGVDLGIAGDDELAITAAIESGLSQCDALITSGGVSVGDFDEVKTVLDRLGDMQWWQVAVRPAKPFAFGLVAGKPVFGLPGNPVSSMVSYELFARPALRKMAGHSHLYRPRMAAVADQPLSRTPDGKVHLMRVVATPGEDGRYHVRSSGGQGSHMLRATASANALAVVPDGAGIASGETVEVMLLGGAGE